MKKEEILKKAKEENKNKDYASIAISNKGATIAGLVMIILAAVYFTYEILTGKGTNYALYSLLAIYNTILYGYQAIKSKEKRGLHIFTSVIWGVLTILLVVSYFMGK
jgi:hypothetical protein